MPTPASRRRIAKLWRNAYADASAIGSPIANDGGADDMHSGDIETAKLFGKRVADVAAKFQR